MNHKLAGILFILLGAGFIGDSVYVIQNDFQWDYQGIKTILGLLLGIASCIYGFKRYKNELPTRK